MPRSPESNKRIREESRAKILAHALRLFAQHGYDRTSVRMLAESAGISPGLLYNYYPGKEALLRAIFERGLGDVEESFAVARAAPPGARVEAVVRGAFDVLRRNEEFWRLSYGVRMQSAVLVGLGDATKRWAEALRSALEGYLRDDGSTEPATDAAILFAVIDGVAQHYVLDPDRYPLDSVVERVVARFGAVSTRARPTPGRAW
jgi:AcrR family transcriptional regulator